MWHVGSHQCYKNRTLFIGNYQHPSINFSMWGKIVWDSFRTHCYGWISLNFTHQEMATILLHYVITKGSPSYLSHHFWQRCYIINLFISRIGFYYLVWKRKKLTEKNQCWHQKQNQELRCWTNFTWNKFYLSASSQSFFFNTVF